MMKQTIPSTADDRLEDGYGESLPFLEMIDEPNQARNEELPDTLLALMHGHFDAHRTGELSACKR